MYRRKVWSFNRFKQPPASSYICSDLEVPNILWTPVITAYSDSAMQLCVTDTCSKIIARDCTVQIDSSPLSVSEKWNVVQWVKPSISCDHIDEENTTDFNKQFINLYVSQGYSTQATQVCAD